MNIGIYGGTFDPPHLGHMLPAMRAAEELGISKLIYVPAATPPHKSLQANSATAEQRLEMVKLAIDEACLGSKLEVVVDDLELRREGNSYTSDTLRAFKKRYPSDKLTFFMGSDMLRSFHTWHEPGVICALADLAVFGRDELGEPEEPREENWKTKLAAFFSEEPKHPPKLESLWTVANRVEEAYLGHVTILFGTPIEISSTEIRKKLRTQKGCPEKLPIPVYGYILLHGLYGTNADLGHLSDDDLRACSLSMVYAKRHAHILGVEAEAVKLARVWGCDETTARRAAILHDCTKYWPTQRHLDYCRDYGVELDELELKSEKLLHAKTGALVARHIFGQSDAVFDAIYCHTTGKKDMTLLDKIIYIADYMEPNRNFPGVERLRGLAYADLDAAVALGCEMSIGEMEEKGREVHPNTRMALASLRH